MKQFILAGLTVACAVAASAQPVPEQRVVNGIVAIVNTDIITEKEARTSIEPGLAQLRRQPWANQQEFEQKALDVYRDGLNRLIADKLILHDFKNAGGSVPESLIERFIEARIREKYGDRAKLTKSLSEEGVTYETFRKEIREHFIIEHMLDRNISSVVVVSPFKVETFFNEHAKDFKLDEQVKVRVIVFNKATPDDATKAKLAAEILKKIEGGAAFAEMAGIYSDGSQRAAQGDWGWHERTYFRKELADLAFNLKPGQRTGVIETPDACYLMLVEDRRAAGVKPLVEVRPEIEKTLLGQEHVRLQNKYIEKLKKTAFVRYF